MYTYKGDSKEVHDANISLNKIRKWSESTPLIKSVDLDDAGSIRRVIIALNYYLTNRVLNNATPESELFKR
jgi:hypothetical protein